MTSAPFQPADNFTLPEGMVRSPFKEMPHAFLGQDETSYLWINQFPVTPGHVLVLPRREIASAFELTRDEIVSHMTLAHQVVAALNTHYQPVGYTMGWNVGVAGGQSVAHAHMHIMPHYGDVAEWHEGIGRLPLGDQTMRHVFSHPLMEVSPHQHPEIMAELFEEIGEIIQFMSEEDDAPQGYNLAWTIDCTKNEAASLTLIERHQGDMPNPRGGITKIFPALPEYYAQKNAGTAIAVQKPITLKFNCVYPQYLKATRRQILGI